MACHNSAVMISLVPCGSHRAADGMWHCPPVPLLHPLCISPQSGDQKSLILTYVTRRTVCVVRVLVAIQQGRGVCKCQHRPLEGPGPSYSHQSLHPVRELKPHGGWSSLRHYSTHFDSRRSGAVVRGKDNCLLSSAGEVHGRICIRYRYLTHYQRNGISDWR